MGKAWIARHVGWALAAGSMAVLSCGQDKKADGLPSGASPSADHRVISNNYAGIQNNAFEFKGIFTGYKTHSQSLSDLNGPHDRVLDSVKNAFAKEKVGEMISPDEFNQYDAIQSSDQKVNYNDVKDKNILKFLREKKPSGFSSLDKDFRTKGVDRYSITFSTPLTGDADSVASQWVGRARQYPKSINLSRKGAEAAFGLFVFDVVSLKAVIQAGLFNEMDDLRKRFYEGNMGNPRAKAKSLAQRYKKVDIVLLQEASKEITEEMKKADYEAYGLENRSMIYLRKDAWNAAEIVKVHASVKNSPFKPTEKRYGKGKVRKLNEKEVVAVKATDKKGATFLLVSAHSDSPGQWSPAIVDGVSRVAGGAEKVIIGHDANTNPHGKKKGKFPLDEYVKFAQGLGFNQSFSKDTETVNKTRSNVQTQLSKAGEVTAGKSDHILIRGLALKSSSVVEKGGPRKSNPADHAILYIDFDN